MVFKIKEFESFKAVEDALGKEISEAKSRLGKCLQRLDGIRELAEKTKKIRQVIGKLAGNKAVSESLGELSVDGLTVVLNAGPLDELTAYEMMVRSNQELLSKLQKACEGLKPLAEFGDTSGLKFLIVENNGVPERILLKVS